MDREKVRKVMDREKFEQQTTNRLLDLAERWVAVQERKALADERRMAALEKFVEQAEKAVAEVVGGLKQRFPEVPS